MKKVDQGLRVIATSAIGRAQEIDQIYQGDRANGFRKTIEDLHRWGIDGRSGFLIYPDLKATNHPGASVRIRTGWREYLHSRESESLEFFRLVANSCPQFSILIGCGRNDVALWGEEEPNRCFAFV